MRRPSRRCLSPGPGGRRPAFPGETRLVSAWPSGEGGKTVFTLQSPLPNERVYSFTLFGEKPAPFWAARKGSTWWTRAPANCCTGFRGHTGSVLAVAPSPDGRFFPDRLRG